MADRTRAVFGFVFGLIIMAVALQIFLVNRFDFDTMQRGVEQIARGLNPWTGRTRIELFYNPPFSVLFLWPMLIVPQKLLLATGGALLIAFVFYTRAWVAFAWFGTNLILWLFAAGSMDMFLMGAGLLLLVAGDNVFSTTRGLVWRVLAYGLLLVKPQGGLFIVAIYLVIRRDWKGLGLSSLLYGLPFFPFWGDWFRLVLTEPPLAQTVATRTIYAQFGPIAAVIVAILVLISRRWKYWQLGGAMAGILMPYGMTGLPTFLILTAVRRLVAIPIVIVYSALLAMLTWVTPPPGLDYYAYVNPLLAIYHLGMMGLAIVLACMSPSDSDNTQSVDLRDWFKRHLSHKWLPG